MAQIESRRDISEALKRLKELRGTISTQQLRTTRSVGGN